MNVIQLNHVSKSFKGLPVLDTVTASFRMGRVYGIVGPNGSGKSVLFKLICGFLSPDSGTVTIEQRFLSAHKIFPESFGVIIDRPAYLPGLTGIDNLRTLARVRGVIDDTDIKAAMDRVGLDPALKQRVRNYSLGMKQKLALAQAFMEGQQVLLLDEPFNGLDLHSVETTRTLLQELNSEGRTIIFTSHNPEDMDLLAQHRFRLNRGTLEAV